MPLIHSSSDAAFKENVRNLMHEVGQSPHVKSRAQALAIAYDTQRRPHRDVGGQVGGFGGLPGGLGGLLGGQGGLGALFGGFPQFGGQAAGMPPSMPAAGVSPAPSAAAPSAPMPTPVPGATGDTVGPFGHPRQQGIAGMQHWGGPTTNPMAMTPAPSRPMQFGADGGRALGGMLPSLHTLSDYNTRHALNADKAFAPKIHAGPILGHTMGRGDRIPMTVASGSYVLPADHISHLGEGNTIAGFKHVNNMFGGGPYGAAMPKQHAGGIHMPGIASGGTPYHGGHGDESGEPVDIMAADGEYVLTPKQVKQKFPNLKIGHESLDEWVMHERKRHIAKLKSLPGPVKE